MNSIRETKEENLKYDEQTWVEKFHNGNNKALAYFFDLHYKALFYFCNQLIKENFESEDIVSVCFLKLWQRRDGFTTAQSIKAFLFITCRNACLDYLRQLQRRNTRQEEYLRQLDTTDVGILNQVVESQFLNVLYQEVAQLPEQCGKVFSLIYFEGKKTHEIAEIMMLSVKTVRNHKARAIELLHNSFLKRGISDALIMAFFVFLNKK